MDKFGELVCSEIHKVDLGKFNAYRDQLYQACMQMRKSNNKQSRGIIFVFKGDEQIHWLTASSGSNQLLPECTRALYDTMNNRKMDSNELDNVLNGLKFIDYFERKD